MDQTSFYPAGGGQPSDVGSIFNANLDFTVTKVVRSTTDDIDHIGTVIKGNAVIGDSIEMQVNSERRQLHNRLHTAGHLIDAALATLNITNLVPEKGYHYPGKSTSKYT